MPKQRHKRIASTCLELFPVEHPQPHPLASLNSPRSERFRVRLSNDPFTSHSAPSAPPHCIQRVYGLWLSTLSCASQCITCNKHDAFLFIPLFCLTSAHIAPVRRATCKRYSRRCARCWGKHTQHSKRISCAECRGECEETIHPLAGATGRAVEPCVFEQALSFLT